MKCSTLTGSPDNYDKLEAIIPGPKGSPYEGAVFKLAITCGEQYPFRPPSFKFTTPVFHPNIDNCRYILLHMYILVIFDDFKSIFFISWKNLSGSVAYASNRYI